MILTRALEHGWRQRAGLHASLMVPSDLLLALLDAVQAGRAVAESLGSLSNVSRLAATARAAGSDDALAAWRKVVGE